MVGQYQRTVDMGSGTGIVVIGLACLIIGETQGDGAGVHGEAARHGVEQGGFPRPVGANDGGEVAGGQMSGTGIVVIGLACLIIGETVAGRRGMGRGILAVMAGSIIYRFIYAIVFYTKAAPCPGCPRWPVWTAPAGCPGTGRGPPPPGW